VIKPVDAPHQKYFACDTRITERAGRRTLSSSPNSTRLIVVNRFRGGNARVLIARLEDGRFLLDRTRRRADEMAKKLVDHRVQGRVGQPLATRWSAFGGNWRGRTAPAWAQMRPCRTCAALQSRPSVCKSLRVRDGREFPELQGVWGGIMRWRRAEPASCRQCDPRPLSSRRGRATPCDGPG